MAQDLPSLGKTDFAGRDGFVWWVGEVEKVDSEFHRVKVRILGWYTGALESQKQKQYLADVPTDDLPWAWVLLPNDHAGIKNTGKKCELQVGAVVMGFFVDGETAQQPVVMGTLRGTSLKDNKVTWLADEKEYTSGQNNYHNKTPGNPDETGVLSDGNQMAVTPDTKAAPGGDVDQSNGAGITKLEAAIPGNAVTNPIKPEMANGLVPVADGVEGPNGEGFEKDISRMLTSLGNALTGVCKTADGYFSVVTGKLVDLSRMIDNIKGFISRAIAGILSKVKEILAQAITKIINAIVTLVSNFLPLAATLAILELLKFIFDLFCNFEATNMISFIQSALSDVTGFVDQLVNRVMDKITSFAGNVVSTVNSILSRVQDGIQKILSIISVVTSAIAVIKGVAKAVGALGDIFTVDFKNLDFASIVKLIKAILGLFLKKDCGRKTKKAQPRGWLPLLGATTCDTVGEFLTGKPPKDYASSLASGASYIDNYFTELDPNLMNVISYMNGAKVINDATPGKEKTITVDAGGQSKFSDQKGNTHYQYPGNETKTVGKDSCENIKGHKCVTIEGDYTLKVMGNFNLEVSGAFNDHTSSGFNLSKGENKQPKTASTKANDHSQNIQGDIKYQAANISYTAISAMNLKASNMKVEAVTQNNSVEAEQLNEVGIQTNVINTMQVNMIALMNPVAPITGQYSLIAGPAVTMTKDPIGIALASGPPPVQLRVSQSIKSSGYVDLGVATGGSTGHITLLTGTTGGIAELVTCGSGMIVNNVTTGVAVYNVNTGMFAAGCQLGPAQFYGLPLMLN